MAIRDKPEWKDAPDWANYLAMNESGSWYWHEYKPKSRGWYWDSNGQYEEAFDDVAEWTKSLTERPE